MLSFFHFSPYMAKWFSSDVTFSTFFLRNLLVKGLGKFAEREQLYSEHRSDVRFIQTNDLSQHLAFDARLVETLKHIARSTDDEDNDDVDDDVSEENIAMAKDILEKENYFREGGSVGSSCEEEDVQCEDDLYRRIDGTCNNLKHSSWGSAGRILLR